MSDLVPLYPNYTGPTAPMVAPGRADYLLQFPSWIDQVSVSTVNATWTPPAGARFVLFSTVSGVNIAVKPNGAAVFPSGAVSNGSASYPNPVGFELTGINTLGIIADSAGTVTMICYG